MPMETWRRQLQYSQTIDASQYTFEYKIVNHCQINELVIDAAIEQAHNEAARSLDGKVRRTGGETSPRQPGAGFNWRGDMGILDKVGEIAGAVAAVEGAEKLDPNAGFLTKAAAAVAGFEGAKEVEQLVEKKEDEKPADDNTAQPADGSDQQA